MRRWLRLRFFLPLAALVLTLGGSLPAAGAEGFEIIINAANPVPALPAAEVSRYFLHATRKWPSGLGILPVDLPEDSPVRDAFSHEIHGKSTSAVKAYWQRLIFSGRDVPPPEKSAAEAMGYVRSQVGAIAYVAAGTPLGSGVKMLKVTR
jgi:hypothetical protein